MRRGSGLIKSFISFNDAPTTGIPEALHMSNKFVIQNYLIDVLSYYLEYDGL